MNLNPPYTMLHVIGNMPTYGCGKEDVSPYKHKGTNPRDDKDEPCLSK